MRTPADDVRDFLEHLSLSDTEGAEALALSNAEVTMRQYKNPNSGRAPAPPTLRLMELTVRLVEGLQLLRSGNTHRARTTFESMLTPALLRKVEEGPGHLVTLKREPPPAGG